MVKRPEVLNNWLVFGIILLVVAGASTLIGWTGLALTVLITGGIFFLIGLYVAWFTTHGVKKLKKSS